jgi:5-formyltetrahydrofolate cyclo-ligase
VPAVAYDSDGNRLGRGKGFYDRLLSRCRAIKIGVAYDFQLVEEIAAEPHDVKVDMIVTEKRMITLKND